MKWLINLFKGKEDEVHTGPSDFHRRIAEIQDRIAAVRSRNGWDQESYKTTKIQSKPVVEQKALPVNSVKNTDMDSLKLKLRGNK
jgi:hypothetical protein